MCILIPYTYGCDQTPSAHKFHLAMHPNMLPMPQTPSAVVKTWSNYAVFGVVAMHFMGHFAAFIALSGRLVGLCAPYMDFFYMIFPSFWHWFQGPTVSYIIGLTISKFGVQGGGGGLRPKRASLAANSLFMVYLGPCK